MSDARWSLRNIYLYLVCLITLIMVIVGAAGTIRTAAELAYPDPGGYDIYAPVKTEGAMTQEDIEEQQRLWRAQSTRQGILNLAGNIALVVIAGPLYVYHWRKIEMELDEAEGADPGQVS